MTGPVFVDTNVLVYGRDASEPVKQARAADWLAQLWQNRLGRISTQVLNEFYVTVTRKLKPGMDPGAAREDIRSLMAWRPEPVDSELVEIAWTIQDQHGYSFWDSLIFAAALQSGSRYLLTEDFEAGRQVGDILVVNPFRTSWSEI